MAKSPPSAASSARALMAASKAMPQAPSAPLSAVSPLVRSFGEMGAGGPGNTPLMPRPADVFTTGAFGPGTPTWPMAIDDADADNDTLLPRRTQYPVWWNVPTGQPGSEGLGKLAPFGVLRSLADQYPVARKCIEDRKKEIIGLAWDVTPTTQAELAMAGSDSMRTDWQKRRGEVLDFLQRPDRSPDSPYDNWAEWMEALLEDRYVCDAVSLYLHPPLGGKGAGVLGSNVGSIDLLDGTTIRPLYDMRGGTPPPSTPAYQQYLWGVPRSDYATIAEGRDEDELPDYVDEFKYREMIYLRDHKRTWAPYGMSFIERALMPIQIGLARLNGQLQYWTEGSVPYMFVIPGAELISSPQQVRQLQNALNSIAGDTGFKQKIVVLPPGSTPSPIKPNPLSDGFDELVIGLVAMQLGLTAQKIGIQTSSRGLNSSSGAGAMAKQQSQNEDDTWLEPETAKLKILHDFIIQKVLKQGDMQFRWTGLEAPEDESQKTTDAIAKFKASVWSLDQTLEEIGSDPLGETWSSVPLVFGVDGAMMLSTAVQAAAFEFEQAQKAPPPGALVEAPWVPVPPTPAAPGAAVPSGGGSTPAKPDDAEDADGTPNTAAHHAASAAEAAKPKPPTSAKLQLSELEILKRITTKGRDPHTFIPKDLAPETFARVLAKIDTDPDGAIETGREMVLDEQRRYLADLSVAVLKGAVAADVLAHETGRLIGEGVITRAPIVKGTATAIKTADVYDYLAKNYPEKDLGWVKSCEWREMHVDLADINMGRRPNGARDPKKVDAIADRVTAGEKLAPVVLVTGDGDRMTIADGYHRTLGTQHAGATSIDAWVGVPPEDLDWQDDVSQMHADKLNKSIEEILEITGKAIAGTERHPGDTERLKEYWTHGAGAAQIDWGVDGDFDRCRAAVGKYLPPEDVSGYCANLHDRATGAWPGHAPGETHAKGLGDESPVGIARWAEERGWSVPSDLIEKVGPKGYIHGWIFVGVPGEGDAVRHPSLGSGNVIRHRELGGEHHAVTVKWGSGAITSHDAYGAHAGEEPKFVPREGSGHENGPTIEPVPEAAKPEDIPKVPVPEAKPETPPAPTDHAATEEAEYQAARGNGKSAQDTFADAYEAYKKARTAKMSQHIAHRNAEGRIVEATPEERIAFKAEEDHQNAVYRGINRAALEKDAEEGKAFKTVDTPAQGWKQLTKAEVVQHMTAKAIGSGTQTVKANVAAKAYSSNHEVHLFQDGSIVSVKKGTLPVATRKEDLQEMLDTTAQLRALYPNRPAHHVKLGESVTGRFGGGTLGNAFPGKSYVGVSKAVFSTSRHSSRSGGTPKEGQRIGWWMPQAAQNSTAKTVLAHEFGHTLDDEGPLGVRRNHEATKIMSEGRVAGDLSTYGMTDNEETYAEAFMEWQLSAGNTDNPTVQRLAAHYGWKA